MGREFGRPQAGAIALLAALAAALTASAATAGGVDFPEGRSDSVRASPCGQPGERCARISGYIKAGADVPARQLEPPLRLGAPLSAGRLGAAVEDSLLPGVFSLLPGRDEFAR